MGIDCMEMAENENVKKSIPNHLYFTWSTHQQKVKSLALKVSLSAYPFHRYQET